MLQSLQSAPDGLTLSEVAEQLAIAPSSAHDLLHALTSAEVVAEQRGRRYVLGPRAIGLAFSIASSIAPLRVADQDARNLCEVTGEDVLIAVRSGNHVMYAVKHNGTTPLKVDVQLGSPRPLHATSVGKLFLANHQDLRDLLDSGTPLPALTPSTITSRRRLDRELAFSRSYRYSVTNQESIVGVIGFAAPVFGADGSLVLAIHVSLPTQRAPQDHLAAVIPALAEAAAVSTARLGGTAVAPAPDLTEAIIARLDEVADLPKRRRRPAALAPGRGRP